MYVNEFSFEEEVIAVLKKDRTQIKPQYHPFKDLKYSVDIKSNFKEIEEWRELKIINYRDKASSIQNLWKGVGKVMIMQDLADKYLKNNPFSIRNFLTLPEYDFKHVAKKTINSVTSLISIEVFNEEKTLKFVSM